MSAPIDRSVTTRQCHADLCLTTTREGKPYCSDHVSEHPYVQAILDTLADRHAEEERVRTLGGPAVDPEGLTAKELLLHLNLHGSRTVERLCRELQLDAKVVEAYVTELVRRGDITISRTNRGSTVVSIVGTPLMAAG